MQISNDSASRAEISNASRLSAETLDHSASRAELRPHLVLAVALLCVLGSTVSPVWAQSAPALAQQMIVKWKSSLAPSAQKGSMERAMSETQARFGTRMIPMRTLATQGQVMRLERTMSTSDFQKLIRTLAADPAVEYAHEDLLLEVEQVTTPNDPLYPQQAGRYVDLRVREFVPGHGSRVAVIDSGIRRHPDLAPNLVGGYDFISDPFIANDGDGRDANPLDPGDFTVADACGPGSPATESTWHGTHVAGMIGAVSDNGFGIAGMGDGTQVVPIRAIGRCGGRISDVIDALMWAAGFTISGVPDNRFPARIINMSLSALAPCVPAAQAAIDQVTAGDLNYMPGPAATVIVAAGNGNIDAANSIPANCNHVIAVAALTDDGRKAPYSNFGSVIDIAAAGGDFTRGMMGGVLSTSNAGTTVPGADAFTFKQGTSMATAHVSAIVARVSAWYPYIPNVMESLLKESTPQGPSPCIFPACIRAIQDYNSVFNAVRLQQYFVPQ